MGKIIFMLLIAAITWVLFKKSVKPPTRTGDDDSHGQQESADAASVATAKPGAGNTKSSAASERMVACSACGVFMPESDSVRVNEVVSCREPARCAHRPKVRG